jgi:hypothetical protein
LARFGGFSIAGASVLKKAAHAAEQQRSDVAAARQDWASQQPWLDPAKLIFLSETGINTKMTRLRGRAPKGERCVAALPQGHWMTTTLIAGLCQGKIVAPMLPILRISVQ